MKFATFLFSTVLLSYLSGHTVNAQINSNNVDRGIERNHLSENNKRKLELFDLNMDVHFLIIEQMNIKDLANFAEATSANYVVDFFRKRYNRLKLTYAFAKGFPLPEYEENGSSIEIRSLEMILSVLKNFGCTIKHLEIHISTKHKEYATIERFINKYGSESLITLNLQAIYTFEHFTVPFKCLEELHFRVYSEITNGILPLNQLFPKLRRLYLELDFNSDLSFLDYKFSHMEHIDLIIRDESWQKRKQIERFLRKNNQVRSLVIFFVTQSYPIFDLKIINEMLPNIENLTCQTFNIGNEPVHFENVKHFGSFSTSLQSIDKLSFGHLESLRMRYMFSEDFEPLMRFFNNHSNLTRLDMEFSCNSQKERPTRMFDELSHLSEIKLNCVGDFEIELISQIIEKHGELIKFEFLTNRPPADGFDILRNQFNDEWNIFDIENRFSSGLSFVRNNQIADVAA